MSKEIETKVGQIRIELLFKGSKSEALYPVLHCEDGNNYRFHIKGNEGSDSALLEPWNELDVKVLGEVDDLRGHWRMLIDSNLEDSISLISSEVGEDEVDSPKEIRDLDLSNPKDQS
jgi:hypothetical protein